MQDQFETRFKNVAGGRILDVATGRGQSIPELIGMFASYEEVVGIDFNSSAIEAARDALAQKPLERVRFEVMSADALDFPDDSFDVVFISNSLHHLADVATAMAEMRRVLKPGGYLIIAEMHRDYTTEAQRMHVDFHHWWASVDRRAGIVHNETFTRQQLCDIATSTALSTYEYYDPPYELDMETAESVRQQMIDITENYCDKIKDHPDYEPVKAQGRNLIDQVKRIGWAWAPYLIIVGQK